MLVILLIIMYVLTAMVTAVPILEETCGFCLLGSCCITLLLWQLCTIEMKTRRGTTWDILRIYNGKALAQVGHKIINSTSMCDGLNNFKLHYNDDNRYNIKKKIIEGTVISRASTSWGEST